MTDIKRTITLHGALADKFGDKHEAHVSTAFELISFMNSVSGDNEFTRALDDDEYCLVLSDNDGNQETLTADTLVLPFTDKDINIDVIPRVAGEKSDAGRFLTATIVTAIGVYTGQTWITQAGIALYGNAITTILAPTPTVDNSSESGLYSGGTNNTKIGSAIPIVYGETMTGSIQASFGVDVVEWTEEA